MDRINIFESKWRETHYWAGQTGQGVLESEGKLSLDHAINKRFKYYFDLEPVFTDRASSHPKMTTDDLFATESTMSQKSDFDSLSVQSTLTDDRKPAACINDASIAELQEFCGLYDCSNNFHQSTDKEEIKEEEKWTE